MPSHELPPQPADLRRVGASDLEALRADLQLLSSPPSSPAISASLAAVATCPACLDSGWRGASAEEAATRQLVVLERYARPAGERLVVICPDCTAGRVRAWAWTGLPDEAADARLDDLVAIPDQDQAFAAVQAFVTRPIGWVTLAGGYGTGKTTLIYAALNALAARGVYGSYWTAPALIDHLRDAIRDTEGRAHSERLARLASVPILAIDELDKFYATPYADEQIFKLFNARYERRRTHGTLIGYNLDGQDTIPPFLRSRIRDGRFQLIEMVGADVRPSTGDLDLDAWDRGEGEPHA